MTFGKLKQGITANESSKKTLELRQMYLASQSRALLEQ